MDGWMDGWTEAWVVDGWVDRWRGVRVAGWLVVLLPVS